MTQKRLDASDETMRLTLRLTKRQTHGLDELRGSRTRSEFLRGLLDLEIGRKQLQEAYPDEQTPKDDAHRSAGQIIPKTTMKIVPEKKHYHRFVRGEQVGHTMRGTLQVPIYRYECGKPGCDVAEERP